MTLITRPDKEFKEGREITQNSSFEFGEFDNRGLRILGEILDYGAEAMHLGRKAIGLASLLTIPGSFEIYARKTNLENRIRNYTIATALELGRLGAYILGFQASQ